MTNPPAMKASCGRYLILRVYKKVGRTALGHSPLVKTNLQNMAPGGEHEATLSRYQKKTPVANLLASHAGVFRGARFSSLPIGGKKDELP